MIPVEPQQEPSSFNDAVRKKGYAFLEKHSIKLDAAPPRGFAFKPYWQGVPNKILWDTYGGICAYLAIFFEYSTGASTTDHFVPKSKNAGLAYEWSNYRLACLALNRKKGDTEGILDPFTLEPETFILNLSNGHIRPNPALASDKYDLAMETIRQLELDSEEHNRMRARHFSEYLRYKHEEYFQKNSPFVWYEAKRQGVLLEEK